MGLSPQAPPHPALWPLRFIGVEALSGVALLAATALALAWANCPWAGAYEALWHLQLGLGVAQYLPAHDLRFWINDGLMSVFFLVVGLEIRREMHDGALSDPRVATLPIVAATGGVPARRASGSRGMRPNARVAGVRRPSSTPASAGCTPARSIPNHTTVAGGT